MGEERRITDLTAISAFRANDYIAVDNASEAQTKKLPASAITGAISAAQTDATRALNIARSTSSFPTGDAYSSSSAYKVGDMVIYNNTLYRCKTACSPASWSVNASNFEATSLASALTDVNNDLSNIGNITTNSNTVSVGNNSTTNITNISLSPGKYIIVAVPTYSTLVAADIVCSIIVGSASQGGFEMNTSTAGYLTHNAVRIVNITSTSTVYLRVLQKTGQTVSVSGVITAIRIA